MITLCTLFNSNYLDKGLTMYESIDRYTHDFILYVLCLDDRCYEIITDLNLPRFIPIKLSDYETDELIFAKSNRSFGEYCWTNSACFTDYIMNTYNPEYCAYIDSDLYFYDDVNVVMKEMQERNVSVMITGHRFNWYDRKEMEWRVGKYCVEFNTFKNDENGRFLLATWKRQCIEYCKCDGDGIHWADQKYMDNWCDDYQYCVETENLGMGIAPWNIAQYKMLIKDEHGPVRVMCRGEEHKTLFYHFQNLSYIDECSANSHTGGYWNIDNSLVYSIYIPYMKHIKNNKNMLRYHYGVEVLLKRHPGVEKKEKNKLFKSLTALSVYKIGQFMSFLLYHRIPHLINKNAEVICID